MAAHKAEVLIYRTWKLRLAVVLLVSASVLIAWAMYDLGQSNAVSDLASLQAERARFLDQIRELDARNQMLEQHIVMLERAQQIDQETYGEVKRDHAGLSQKIQELREQLAFYRGIMSPAEAKAGLQLQDFSVERSAEPNEYHFRLVLTQVKKRHPIASGRVSLHVLGKQGDAMKRLSLGELSGGRHKDDAIAYRFRYFQTIEGSLTLPDAFEPTTVRIRAMPAGKNAPKNPLEWTFNWPGLAPPETRKDDQAGYRKALHVSERATLIGAQAEIHADQYFSGGLHGHGQISGSMFTAGDAVLALSERASI